MNAYNAKEIEPTLLSMMMGLADTSSPKYEIPQNLFNHLQSYGFNQFHNIQFKPKVTQNTYGGKTEPKSDINFTSNGKSWKLSIKQDDDAYLVSCNNPKDFITQMITIHDGESHLSESMINKLIEVSNLIKKVPNFSSYNHKYQSRMDIDGFIKYKTQEKLSKYLNQQDVDTIQNYIKECYQNPVKQAEYQNYLHNSESFLQSTIKELFTNYPDYSKRIIFEFLTGNHKFKWTDASSNCVVTRTGFYLLDSYDCEFVNLTLAKFLSSKTIGRLQNVPRTPLPVKIIKTKDKQIIADKFSEADLTFKI